MMFYLYFIPTNLGVEEVDIDPQEVARHEAFAAKKQKRPQNGRNGRKKKLSPETSLDDNKKSVTHVKASDSEAESISSVPSVSTGGEIFEENAIRNIKKTHSSNPPFTHSKINLFFMAILYSQLYYCH